MNIVSKSFVEHRKVLDQFFSSSEHVILSISKILSDALIQDRTLFWCGNGGSAADCQHLVAEFVGKFNKDRRALRSIALTTYTSILTCVANDYSYEDVFSRQVQALGKSGDILIGLSTSGNSENILRAFKTAKKTGLHTIGLLGKGGGKAKDLVDNALIIPSDTTARVQELHILIGHIFCELIERELKID